MQTQRISGSIEVMFMQYNPQNSMVRVNVLRGYQLVARDYPSMTSNPFFTLKISPSWWDQGTLESAPKQGINKLLNHFLFKKLFKFDAGLTIYIFN